MVLASSPLFSSVKLSQFKDLFEFRSMKNKRKIIKINTKYHKNNQSKIKSQTPWLLKIVKIRIKIKINRRFKKK